MLQNMSSGRPNYGSGMPTEDFQKNIEKYKHNRFLYIGKLKTFVMCGEIIFEFLGDYPHFLWLFKEISADLKEHFVFHDHLLQHVEDWKRSIRNNIQKNVIFIGKCQLYLWPFDHLSFIIVIVSQVIWKNMLRPIWGSTVIILFTQLGEVFHV